MDKKNCIDIFERYIRNEATTDEIEKLRTYIRQNKELEMWMEQQIEGSSDDISVAVRMRMLKNIRTEIHHTHHYPPIWAVMKWAAVIAIPIALIVSLYFNFQPEDKKSLVIVANQGEKANVVLPDGSKVDINSASKITYSNDYNKVYRSLQLEGEAYFDVKHDKTKPFVVKCQDIRIAVLGTTFGIRAYKEDKFISVVLKTGKIILQTPSEYIVMHPNERIIYNCTTQKTETESVVASEYVNWRQDRLRFDDETIEEIMRVISRTHNINIRFSNDSLKKQRFTGTLDNKNIETVMNMISQTSTIKFKFEKDGILLY